METKKDIDIANIILLGWNTLNSKEVKVSACDVEKLAQFKEILKAILDGKLVIASPDRVIPVNNQDAEEED